ncbi:phage portal protein [Hirschia baltica]|uniref:Phage portal protein, HK97 family n=1 Tax=Hirschia baltica (strain ATCC 49814 / DSM 5838 / IFAM 1418) TaxID=582402 RepID=C6XIB5_HIRBI|nr:phage portal protein [Hirschia baltica]ACT58941.1 phage portal protein, HK97 family [Hirschia baltica ATCC 49814]
MFPFKTREAKASGVPFVALSQLGTARWTRDKISLAREGMVNNAIGYRCVRLIAEAAAGVRWKASEGGEDALALLDNPNPEQSGIELMEAFYGHLQTNGNAYLHGVVLDDGAQPQLPRQIYTLRPDRVTPIIGAHGWPLGWNYKVDRMGKRFMREADGWSPVLHFKLFHPLHDHDGLAPLEAAGKAVDVHNAGAAWAKALIDNSARPSGALVYGKGGDRMTPEQFSRLKQELEELHTGASNAGRPMLLEGGLDWKPMSLTPADMDFIAARHDAAREIALAFGVPPMMLGIPGDNTYSNYKEANMAFWRLTVLPLVEKAGRSLSNWLSVRSQGRIELRPDLESITALTSERDALWARLENASYISDDEKRELAGLPPVTKRGEV